MKLNFKTFFIVALLCIIAVPAFSLDGTVVSVSGKVELQTPSGWTSLKAGDTVSSGLVISTGFRSQAVIQVAGSNIIVSQLSRLTLEQLSETNDAHETEVSLDLGSIRADVKRAQNKRVGFVVNTPVATASVRGTELEVALNSLRVLQGIVDYEGAKGNRVSVSAGNSSNVNQRGSASKPVTNKLNDALGTNSDSEGFIQASIASLNAISETKSSGVLTGAIVVSFELQ